MTTLNLTFFIGSASISPNFAAEELLKDNLNLESLANDLCTLGNLGEAEGPAVALLQTLLRGEANKAISLARKKLSPAVAGISQARWREAIEYAQKTSTPSQTVLTDLPQRLEEWKAKVAQVDRLDVTDPTRREKMETAVSEWIEIVQQRQNVQGFYDARGFYIGDFNLKDEVRFSFVKTLFEKGIAISHPQLDDLVNRETLKTFKPEQIEELVLLYTQDSETTLRHEYNFVRLVALLPGEKQVLYHVRIASLLDPQWIDKYAGEMIEFFKFLHLLHHLNREIAMAMIPALVGIAERANLLNDKKEPNRVNVFSRLHSNALKFLAALQKKFKIKEERTWMLALEPYIDRWLERKIIAHRQLLDVIEKIAPCQNDEWVARVTGKFLLLFTSPNSSNNVYSAFKPQNDLKRLIRRIPEEKYPQLFEPLKVAYYRNPFNEVPAKKQKDLLEWGLEKEATPSIETEAGIRMVVGYSSLKPATKEKVVHLLSNKAHPLTPAQRLLILQSIARANFNDNERSFLQSITAATPADGMINEWFLLMREVQQLGEEDRRNFIPEQNARFARHHKPEKLNPARIRKTLRNFRRKCFVKRISLTAKEEAALQTHQTKFSKAWSHKNFFDHLSTMATFVNETGHEAIKQLVLGIVHSPVDADSEDFSFAFRWQELEKAFGKEFADGWKKRRVYDLDDFQTEPIDPAKAKENFAKQTARQLRQHLATYSTETNGELGKIVLAPPFSSLANNLSDICWKLVQGGYPDKGLVEKTAHFLDAHHEELQTLDFVGLREVQNDLSELLRGWDRSFKNRSGGRVIISGDPRDIIRAGLIGQKTCTRPTEPAEGNKSGEPVERANYGPLLIVIVERNGEEVARTLIKAILGEDGPHITVSPFYGEGGFTDQKTLEAILLADGKNLGVTEEKVHLRSVTRDKIKVSPRHPYPHFSIYEE